MNETHQLIDEDPDLTILKKLMNIKDPESYFSAILREKSFVEQLFPARKVIDET